MTRFMTTFYCSLTLCSQCFFSMKSAFCKNTFTSQINSSFGSGGMTLAMNDLQFATHIKSHQQYLPIRKAACVDGRQPCSNNYQVFCNNFSTAGLFEELLQQNIYLCGTAQIDRHGFPETLKKVAITEQGQHKSCQHGNLVATVWKDKKMQRCFPQCVTHVLLRLWRESRRMLAKSRYHVLKR